MIPSLLVGLDLSLARTGWAAAHMTPEGAELDHGVLPTASVSPGDPNYYALTLARIRRILDRIGEEIALAPAAPLYVAIEGASFGTTREKAAQADARAGLRWMTLDALDPVAECVVVIPPASLKSYMTNNGNAGKPAILDAVRAAFEGCWITDDNEADALGLLAMLARKMGHPIDPEQPWHHGALGGMKWPDGLPGGLLTSAYHLDGLDT